MTPPPGPDSPAPAASGLERVLHGFGNFAVAMSTICILAGGLTSFHVGYCSVGGASIGVGWPLGCLFSLTVALTMAEVASAYPRAGGPYVWAAELGGPAWGWLTGCFNLAGLVCVVAAVNVGLAAFIVGTLGRAVGDDDVPPYAVSLVAAAVTLAQAAVSHRGIRVTSWLTNTSGVLIVVVSLALTACVIYFPLSAGVSFDFSRLVRFDNFSGETGGKVFDATDSVAYLFLLGLLLPAYTITGFDASAQTSEETFDADRAVPTAIVRAVWISGVAGYVMLAALVLAAPDTATAAAKGDGSFFHIVNEVVPSQAVRVALYVGIDVAQFICGLATLTAASRLALAMARDNGLPFSGTLSRIDANHSPTAAVYACAAVTVVLLLFVPYTAIAAVAAVFLYVAYVVPTTWGLVTHGRWSLTGPWKLGAWYRPLAAVAVVGCLALIVIGVQPPNAVALPILAGTVVVLLVLWFGWTRRRFRRRAEEN